MTKAELVKWIQNDITISGQLAITVPDAEIERIIDYETDMVYELYPDALQDSYCIIPLEVFRSQEFKQNRTVIFPKCVKAITKFVEMRRRAGMFGFNDADMNYGKLFATDVWLNSPWNSDVITYRTMSMSVWDQMKQFQLIDCQHSYNRNTHKLLVTGHDPLHPIFCEMMTTVPEQDLWDDPWVKKYISARCKLSVYKLLGTFTVNLVGGTSMNANIYKELADQDVEQCKEAWKQMNQASWFLEVF